MSMTNISKLEALCKQHSNLSNSDILILKKIAPRLETLAKIWNEDVFIDVLCKNNVDAMVIAQAKPEDSNYAKYITGFHIHEEAEPAVFRTFRSGVKTKHVKAVSYTKTKDHLIIQSVIPIKNGKQTIATLIFERSFNVKKPNLEFKISEHKIPENIFTPLVENLDDPVIIINQAKEIIYLNTAAKTLFHAFGYVNQTLGQKYDQISLYGQLNVGPTPLMNFHEGEYFFCNHYFKVKEFFHQLPNAETYYEVVMRNITPIKQNEKEGSLRLATMREMHHRIKNNLQTIYSLLDLQRRRAPSQMTNDALQDAMNRILSMSTTYETLLKGHDEGYGQNINIHAVISDLKNNLIQSTGTSLKEIEINVSGDNLEVEWESSIYIAMVVNELIQNSFKFAFTNKDKGIIDIHITKKPIYSMISVTDNGGGFNPSSQKKNLGLQIVENIVASNLEGKLKIQSGFDGTSVTFEFRVPERLKYTL